MWLAKPGTGKVWEGHTHWGVWGATPSKKINPYFLQSDTFFDHFHDIL